MIILGGVKKSYPFYKISTVWDRPQFEKAMLPFEIDVIPTGLSNRIDLVKLFDVLLMTVTKFPLGSNNCSLLFFQSATIINPSESQVTPFGKRNEPNFLPYVPKLVMYDPNSFESAELMSKICMRWLKVSETIRLIEFEIQINSGLLNWPEDDPWDPHSVKYLPVISNTWIRLFP